MPEFLKLTPPEKALEILLNSLPNSKKATEKILTEDSLNRILAIDIIAPHSLPEFPRSTVDGYAVRANDTHGASESLPGYLHLVGEVPMGGKPEFFVRNGECALIHTGGMVPQGSNAVVMIEYTQKVVEGMEIEISKAVAEGENIIRAGDDVKVDDVVLHSGSRITPAMIGGCMALGIREIIVFTKPRVGIISSGDEVIDPGKHPQMGQVRDVNSYSLSALVIQAGGEPKLLGIVPDNFELLKKTAFDSLPNVDVLLITAGSSASARDMTAEAIRSLGAPGVLVHGVGVRPGKPTILAVCDGKPVIGLPGNPVSALVIARLFVVPVIEKLMMATSRPKPTLLAKLKVNLPSQAGREDWVSVKLIKIGEHENGNDPLYEAEPIFGKSNLIFTLASSDGMVRVPPDATGLSAGSIVEVVLVWR